MPSGVVKLIGALSVAFALLFAAPQITRAQQQRAEVSEAEPADRQLPAPTAAGETLADRGDGVFELGGGQDAGADGSVGDDAGGGGPPRPAPPLDDASCSVAGGAGDLAMCGFLLALGLLFRRRPD